MARTNSFSTNWLFTYLLVGLSLFVGFCHGQRFVKTAQPIAGENQTHFVGVASNTTFDTQEFVIAKFRGIPFVDPQPERFAKPTLGEIQPGLFDATSYKPICQQQNMSSSCLMGWEMSEACLYLNVFVPTSFRQSDLITTTTTTTTTNTEAPRTENVAGEVNAQTEGPTENNYDDALILPNSSSKLAVFIYIYGGAYVSGNGNCFDASNLAGFGNIIVVTFNYRLGALSFLYTKDGAIPGNLALWDQHTAIKWVKRYIHLFGGDPDRITVGGQSAGSYSSILQALYQPNDQLFHRVIAQSGTPVAKNSVIPTGHETSVAVAKLLKCNLSQNPTGGEIKECLMKVPAQDLADVQPPPTVPGGLPIYPVLDGDFVKDDPAVYMSQSLTFGSSEKSETPAHFARKDLLIGITAEDGDIVHYLFTFASFGNDLSAAYNSLQTPIGPAQFRELIVPYFQDKTTDEVDDIVIQSVVDRYTNWELPNDNVSLSNQAIQMYTDVAFAIPSLDTASSHDLAKVQANNVTTFVYRFSLPETDPGYKQSMPWFEGTHHAAEVRYVFGWEQLISATPGGVNASRDIITYWSNFVKTGDPNKDEATSGSSANDPDLPEWKEYTEDEQYYLEFTFDPEQPVSKQRLVADKRHFWSDYIPRLRHRLSQLKKKANNAEESTCPNHGLQMKINHLSVVPLSMLTMFFLKLQ